MTLIYVIAAVMVVGAVIAMVLGRKRPDADEATLEARKRQKVIDKVNENNNNNIRSAYHLK